MATTPGTTLAGLPQAEQKVAGPGRSCLGQPADADLLQHLDRCPLVAALEEHAQSAAVELPEVAGQESLQHALEPAGGRDFDYRRDVTDQRPQSLPRWRDRERNRPPHDSCHSLARALPTEA